ncbi:MAG TPA: cyclic nucleotide-binding domain-containing protein [Mycobacteriales bacterium]|nr:cyclic nucleotide-binding domain-containing protein [Mycobacteriales bacterium]
MARSEHDSEHEEIVETLRALPVFANCDRSDLNDLAEHARRTSLPANWPLIQQETPSDACYVLLSGSADILDGDRKLDTVAAGAVVGEVGLTAHRLRNASVVSTSPLTLLHISASEFTALIERRPALRRAFESRSTPAHSAEADQD